MAEHVARLTLRTDDEVHVASPSFAIGVQRSRSAHTAGITTWVGWLRDSLCPPPSAPRSHRPERSRRAGACLSGSLSGWVGLLCAARNRRAGTPVPAAREQLRLAKGLAAKKGPPGIRSVPNNPTSERAMMERSGEDAAPDKRRQLQNVCEGKWRLAKMNCPKADEGSRQPLES